MASLASARALLLRYFGHADFRPAQRPVIASLLGGRDVLAVLPTGAGKSVCFQVPALALPGLTVVVTPLVALMDDQVGAAQRRGLRAAALHAALSAEARAAVLEALRRDVLKLLYLSPERLGGFARQLRDLAGTPALLAVDEAHCISEWGHDFRPSFRSLRRARWLLGEPQTIALTGSATPEVRRDIAACLGLGARLGGSARGADWHVSSFDRPNLWFGAQRVRHDADRLQRLMALLQSARGIALVYVPTRGVAERVADRLRRHGWRACAYHAGLAAGLRARRLRSFLAGEHEVVVATCAFGMGIDKPDVRLVVHWAPPTTPESYYQEAGRAGRDGEPSRCVALWRPRDLTIHRRQLDVTFPAPALCEAVWRDPGAARGLPSRVAASIERLRGELRPERGSADWGGVRERRRRAERRLAAVRTYLEGRGCRRRRLLEWFGDTSVRCAGCDRCER
ncbi:MAG TPA: RecQ family ATP-dependent DNA helicase [Gemmatimonadales bacterium]|nr:RecQ family ATP-dependent DNA helicase [Gemmatimonadales bacterium]